MRFIRLPRWFKCFILLSNKAELRKDVKDALAVFEVVTTDLHGALDLECGHSSRIKGVRPLLIERMLHGCEGA